MKGVTLAHGKGICHENISKEYSKNTRLKYMKIQGYSKYMKIHKNPYYKDYSKYPEIQD